MYRLNIIAAGDTVTVEMHQQPNDRSCANDAIGVSLHRKLVTADGLNDQQGNHYGPINIYLAQVPDATTANGYDNGWFKINEMGLPSDNPDYWATEVLNVRESAFYCAIRSSYSRYYA